MLFHWSTFVQNTILRQRMQVESNASHIYNTRLTSVNVGEFYRIFTFRFSFWALFDTQLINFIWKYVALYIEWEMKLIAFQILSLISWLQHRIYTIIIQDLSVIWIILGQEYPPTLRWNLGKTSFKFSAPKLWETVTAWSQVSVIS